VNAQLGIRMRVHDGVGSAATALKRPSKALDFRNARASILISPPIQFRIEWADSQGMSPLLGCRPILVLAPRHCWAIKQLSALFQRIHPNCGKSGTALLRFFFEIFRIKLTAES